MARTTNNPFRPGFGISPPVLAGRDQLLAHWDAVFDAASWSPFRAALITGLRGVGKTVLLNAIEDRARDRGWTLVHGTLRPGLVGSLERDRLPSLLRDEDPDAFRRHITGGGIQGIGTITTSVTDEYPRSLTLPSYLERLAELAEARGAGVLVTLDEVSKDSFDDLRVIATAVQHLLREERPVAIAAAGLPASTQAALEADGMTFFRRAEQVSLDTLTYDETFEAIGRPVREHGRTIGRDALTTAVRATLGYPYLVQAVGAHAWEHDAADDEITVEAVTRAIDVANRSMASSVLMPALRGLSERDRAYLAAMAIDDGPASTASVAARIGVDANYGNQYRARLLNQGIIVAPARGTVDFAIPTMRTYLREHPVEQVLGAPTAARRTFPD